MAAEAEDDAAVVAGAGRLGCWEASVTLAGEGKGECRRKRALCHSTKVPVRLHSHRPLTATKCSFPWCKNSLLLLILIEQASFLLVVRRKSLLACICWHLLSFASSHFSWRWLREPKSWVAAAVMCVFVGLIKIWWKGWGVWKWGRPAFCDSKPRINGEDEGGGGVEVGLQKEKRGWVGAAASIGSPPPPLFYSFLFLSFRVSCNGILLGFLVFVPYAYT